MKIYSCKVCKQRKRVFSGTRRDVRAHIKEAHLIKSNKPGLNKIGGDRYFSNITPLVIVEEYGID